MKNYIKPIILSTIICFSPILFCRGGFGFRGGSGFNRGGGHGYYGGGGWGGFGGGLVGGMTGGLIAGSMSQPSTTVVYADKSNSEDKTCECQKCEKFCPECGAKLQWF